MAGVAGRDRLGGSDVPWASMEYVPARGHRAKAQKGMLCPLQAGMGLAQNGNSASLIFPLPQGSELSTCLEKVSGADH